MSSHIHPTVPNMRHRAAMELVAFFLDLMRKHNIDMAMTVSEMDRFSGDLQIQLADKGYMVLSDYTREALGLLPVGMEGWTEREVEAWEQAKLAAILRPVRLNASEDEDRADLLDKTYGVTSGPK